MFFSIKTPLSYSFCVSYSQSTTPTLSPSSLPSLSPPDSLPPSPITPADMDIIDQQSLSLTESISAFDLFAWPDPDVLSCATTLDFPHPSAELDYCSLQSDNHEERHVPSEYNQTNSTLHVFEQGIISGQNSISSVPQKGTGIEQRLSTRAESGGSVRVAPRILRMLRPRSSRPRDGRVAPDLIVNHGQLSSSHTVSANSLGAVSANYRQLSAREVKEMKLGQYRRYYKCLMDGCDRAFSRKSNVENHIRTHLDDKPFICSLSTW
ncbi:unnamed protein product [Rhizoctonia solani]|uniref:C2H2-type domain-containing protein n=1 Tax=Rhizoctonia solani TaxID=456999 RepID=A0A8H2ZZY5_9AGAM|nr:unnamed protein product [Rhizoctonia solani]